MNELETEFFDVVIADIDMPEMRGKELLKEIKYRQPEVTVILTAPFKATEEAVEAVKLGAYDYIPKPFGPHQILLMVYTALQSREMLKKTRRQHAEQRAETIFQRLPVAIALGGQRTQGCVPQQSVHRASDTRRDGTRTESTAKTFGELFGMRSSGFQARVRKKAVDQDGFSWKNWAVQPSCTISNCRKRISGF